MQTFNRTKRERVGLERRNDSRESIGRIVGETGWITGLLEVENKLLGAC